MITSNSFPSSQMQLHLLLLFHDCPYLFSYIFFKIGFYAIINLLCYYMNVTKQTVKTGREKDTIGNHGAQLTLNQGYCRCIF